MRTIYTSQFEILPLDRNVEVVADAVRAAVLGWITDWYDSKCGLKLSLSLTGELEPQPGHTVVCAERSNLRASLKTIRWSYPHKDNLHWTVLIEIVRFEDSLEFSLRLIIESTQFFIAPLTFDFGRPRIVMQILRAFDCYYGGAKLSADALPKSAADVPLLVEERLKNPSRRLPLVLISPETATGLPLVTPSDIAGGVAGIAEVYTLSDKWASFALTDCIGRHVSCYNGAIRVFWPLGAKTLEAFCPVYLPHVIREKGATFIQKALLREFSSISSFRYIQGPVSSDAEAVLDDARNKEQEELRKAAKDSGDFEGLAESYKTEADELRKETAHLRASQMQLTHELSQLRSQLETNQANLAAIYSAVPVGATTQASVSEHKDSRCGTVADVVASAQESYGNILVFTKNSLKSAQASPYKQPERVAEAFEAMSVVCDAWREARRSKEPSGTFEELFDSLGFEYKSRSSQTAVGKWPEEYEMLHRGHKVSIQPHLALGKGGPETCLRIHFYVDDEAEKFVIDHVGRHKTNTST